MDPDQLLQSLGLDLGLPSLRFDANGCARLAIDGAPALNFERDAKGSIHLYSVLCSQPQEGREALYAQLLQGNLFGTSTGGGALAVDESKREVVLCRTIFIDQTTAPAFMSQVEAFVAAAEDWKSRLSSPQTAGTPSAPVPATPMLNHFLRG
jgi:hypothetical protein